MPDTVLSLVRSHAPEHRPGRVTLLERKTALDALAEIAAQARSGEGRLVLLEGEAGVGKSALLEQFTHDLPDSRVLSGACDGMFTPCPLGPLFGIAQQVHGRLHSLCRADASREQLFDAFLTELCEPGPLRRTGSPRRRRQREPAGPYRLQLTGDHRGASELFDALGCPYDAALALLDAPDELALRRALDICDTLGAVATARIIRQRMRVLGIRSVPAGQRAATRGNPLGLTQREQEVLELLCEGRTNASIAAKLVISPKTMEHHVSAVLAKLGISNRTEAAAAARAAATST